MAKSARSFLEMAIGMTALFLGSCTPSETSNPGVGGTGPCLPETDSEFCQRLGTDCDALSSSDNCDAARSVASCGSCAPPATCGGGGIPNRCGDGTATEDLFLDGFFPIGTFIPYPPQLAIHVARGINTAVGIPDTSGEYTDQQWNDAVEAAGMKQIRRPIDGNPALDAGRTSLLAWNQPDEPDTPPLTQSKRNTHEANWIEWQEADPTREILVNFGGSDILNATPYGCNGPGDEAGPEAELDCYPYFIDRATWVANDIYPVNGYLDDPTWRDDITVVGAALDKLNGFPNTVDPSWSTRWTSKPLFAFIEGSQFASPSDGNYSNRGATPDETRAEIWNAIIHGARGYFFFSVVLDPWEWDGMRSDVAEEVTAQNATVTQLAKVLQAEINPPSIGARVSPPLEAGWRNSTNGKYFFVLNTSSSPVNDATIEFTGVGTAKRAAVHGESRTVSITAGSATDDFGPYAIHIYVVD